MHSEPTPQHQWLQQLVGEWTSEMEATMAPDQPPEKFTGIEIVRSIGGLWTLGEGTGSMPGGGTMTSFMTLGYDPAQQRFVGTFIASMMTHMWIYHGQLDSTGNKLVLDTEGPSFDNPEVASTNGMNPLKLAKYKDTIEFLSPDHRTLSSSTIGPDGQWRQFMTAHYRRKGK